LHHSIIAVSPLYGAEHEGNPWIGLSLLTAINIVVWLMFNSSPSDVSRAKPALVVYNCFVSLLTPAWRNLKSHASMFIVSFL
jgi:hypothetical protein